MAWLNEPPLDCVFRRRDYADAVNERRLARLIALGETVRVAPGAFAPASAWRALTPLQRHAQRVWEAAARTEPGTIVCHFGAAAIWGIDILGDWPETVDVSVARTTGGRSTGQLRRRTRDISRLEVVPWAGGFVTSLRQTVVDLAAALPFCAGVVVADRALWARRGGGSLITKDHLVTAASTFGGRGAPRARRVIDFSSPLADSVRESQSRVILDQLGFPEPELQREFVLPSGRHARPDFYWEEFDHAGEFDGVGKYLDPEMLAGRTPQQALLEEKDREDELRRVVRKLSRWRTPALTRPKQLYDILTAAGLPSSRPRPGR